MLRAIKAGLNSRMCAAGYHEGVKQLGFDTLRQYTCARLVKASFRRLRLVCEPVFTHEVRELVQAQCCLHRKKKVPHCRAGLLVETTGLEPVTPCMSSKYSDQLSYASVFACRHYIILF